MVRDRLPAVLAKGALRRLAQAQQEPTPENFARAYAEEAGEARPDAQVETRAEVRQIGAAWVVQLERLARQLPRGGRQWTAARRRESLQRLFEGSRSEPARLQQRLASLITAWETDQAADPEATGLEAEPMPPGSGASSIGTGPWPAVVTALEGTVRAALPADEPDAVALAARLAATAEAIAGEGATPAHLATVEALCVEARRWLGRGHRVVERLAALAREMSEGLAELAEDDSWVQGQCLKLTQVLEGGHSVRGLRAAEALLADTRQRQRQTLAERRAARGAIKELLGEMLREVGELGEHTGRFEQVTARHVEAIAAADSLPALTEVVRQLLDDTRAVQGAVTKSRQKLVADQTRAGELEARVRELETELKRLSEEVTTDALTQVANRRGLMQAFEAEVARARREPAPLAIGLIDIDNFKKLNDSLGHAAGDVALKALATAVQERLRPQDHLARFGGEEFVVILPGTVLDEAAQALTRLQRALTEALFLHEGREVFVTFSAGVTQWREGEALEPALERADQALYEAKRSGKNRTCSA